MMNEKIFGVARGSFVKKVPHREELRKTGVGCNINTNVLQA